MKMRATYDIIKGKLKIHQKDLENMTFNEIITKLILLQKETNYCRVKEEVNSFDIISRIMRKDNYLNAILSNNIIRFTIKIPFLGEKIFFSN